MGYVDLRDTSRQMAVNPALSGADMTGENNSYAAWKAAFDRGVALASHNGGVVHVKPTPAAYTTTWNGATGVDVGLSINPTLMNYRSTFVIDDADVTKVVLDLSGCTIKQGGTTWEDFATWLTVKDADLHVKVDGTTFDFDILLTTQGTITAIQAPTSGDNGYVEFTIDPLFPVQTPEWLDVNGDGVISEVVTCSDITYAMARPERHYEKIVLDRDEYNSEHAAISHQSGSTYRISGLSSSETTAFTNNGGVGTYIVVKHCTDTGAWFKTIGAGKVTIEGIGFVRQSLQHFINTHMVGDGGVSVNGIFAIPREGVSASCMRNFHGGNANYGQYRLSNIQVRGAGDDVLTSNAITLRNMEYVDSTHFDAFAGPHYYGKTIRDGSRVQIYDASSGGYTLVAYGKVEASGTIDPNDGYLARYTFTKDAASSALPSDLTDHVAAVLDTYNPVEWDNCRAINVRGRGGWLGIPIGKVIDCEFTLTTDEGLKVDPAGGSVAGTAYPGGSRLLIKDCVFRLNCRDENYPAALAIFASSEADDTLASTDKIITNVTVEGCQFHNASHMAMLFGGCDTVTERDNLIVSAANSTPVSGQRGYTMGFTSATVIGYANCDNMRLGNATVFKGTGAAAKITGVTHSGGSNADVVFELYDNVDLTTRLMGILCNMGFGTVSPSYRVHAYAASGGTDVMVESGNTDPAKLRMKNTDREMSIFANSSGLVERDETAGANRWITSTDGHKYPAADSTIDLGQASFFLRRAFLGHTILKDGITAPTAVSGQAKLFVDSADGDLKIIFGDGTTKTIVVDT
jgi:hypothetical protein